MSDTDVSDGATTVFATICTYFAQLLPAGSGLPVNPEIFLDIAKEVARLIKGILERLNKIEERIILIQKGPFNTGLLFLQNADAAKDEKNKLQHIEASSTPIHDGGRSIEWAS